MSHPQIFYFEHQATCNDGVYVCNVKTFRNDGVVVENAFQSVESPIIEGCESMLSVELSFYNLDKYFHTFHLNK